MSHRGFSTRRESQALPAEGRGVSWLGLFSSFAKASADRPGEGASLIMRRDSTKNVYFCFGEKAFEIKALSQIHVYFCIPARKWPFEENQGVSRKYVYFCILLYTSHVWYGVVLWKIKGLSATGA